MGEGGKFKARFYFYYLLYFDWWEGLTGLYKAGWIRVVGCGWSGLGWIGYGLGFGRFVIELGLLVNLGFNLGLSIRLKGKNFQVCKLCSKGNS